MINVNTAAIAFCVLGALPIAAWAQSSGSQSSDFSGRDGEREFSISGTGNSDRNLDSGSFAVTGDLGWYLDDGPGAGIRQSLNDVSIEGASIKDEFWNGASRAYLNYQFLFSSSRDASDALQDSGIWAHKRGLGYEF